MRKNILLFVLVLVLSFVTSSFFGNWYDKFIPQNSYGLFGVGRENAIIFTGIQLSYIFFIPFLFELIGVEKRRKWITWFLIPPLLLWLFQHLTFSPPPSQ